VRATDKELANAHTWRYSRLTHSDEPMRHTAFFTFYFWFSHSSPTAVE
jgi:hypothetical protein